MYMTSGITAFERLMYGYFLRGSLTPFSGLVVAESSYVGVSDGHGTNSYSRECQANLFKASISSIILPRRVRLRFHMSSRVTLS